MNEERLLCKPLALDTVKRATKLRYYAALVIVIVIVIGSHTFTRSYIASVRARMVHVHLRAMSRAIIDVFSYTL